MFNDIAAAERSPALASPYGLTFADLYTLEGAARVDALFLAELGSADAGLAQRLAAARAAPGGLAAKDESALLIALAPHVEDFLARLFGIAADVQALEARHHELAPLYAVKRQFVQRKAMNAYKADVAIAFDGERIDTRNTRAMRPLRRRMQIVFQDPFASLSPKMSVRQIVGEGLPIHRPELSKAERANEIERILDEVGLGSAVLDRYPHEFSGGQRQRIAIARAMILEPDLVVLDEPTSALDMTVQVQIVELLRRLQKKYGLAYVFISHDLRVVRALAHEVVVMQNGDVVESGDSRSIFDAPRTEYTRTLLAAAFDLELAAE